jgi:hypothetical protein
LLGHSLGDAFAVSTLELTSKEVTKPVRHQWVHSPLSRESHHVPPFQERDDSPHEKEPNAPARSPKPASRTLTNGTCIETVVYQVLEILGHSDLSHELAVNTLSDKS